MKHRAGVPRCRHAGLGEAGRDFAHGFFSWGQSRASDTGAPEGVWKEGHMALLAQRWVNGQASASLCRNGATTGTCPRGKASSVLSAAPVGRLHTGAALLGTRKTHRQRTLPSGGHSGKPQARGPELGLEAQYSAQRTFPAHRPLG